MSIQSWPASAWTTAIGSSTVANPTRNVSVELERGRLARPSPAEKVPAPQGEPPCTSERLVSSPKVESALETVVSFTVPVGSKRNDRALSHIT